MATNKGEGKKRGAKDKYDVLGISDQLADVKESFRKGVTIAQFCMDFGISPALFHIWMAKGKPLTAEEKMIVRVGDLLQREYDEKYTEFYNTVIEAKRTAYSKLVDTAMAKALGEYEYEKTVYTWVEGELHHDTVTVKPEANDRMLELLLRVRGKDFDPKTKIEHSGSVENRPASRLSDDQLNAIERLANKEIQGKLSDDEDVKPAPRDESMYDEDEDEEGDLE